MNRRNAVRCALVAALVAMIGATAGTRALAQDEPAAPESFVRLVIDYGEGVEKHFNRLAWREGLTVLDAMDAASRLPPPRGLKFDHIGRGETAFVVVIDGLRNEGGGRGARNWVFTVNGALGSASAGVTVLKAGDEARWTYGGSPFDR